MRLPSRISGLVSSLMLDQIRWHTLPHCLERASVLSPNARTRQTKTYFEALTVQRAWESFVPIGAALVRDGTVIASAGNRTRERADPTAHAELLAIRAAAAALGSERLAGCDLYVTLEPCAMCAGAVSHARIRRLYYAAPDPKGGAVDHGPHVFNQPTCHHAPEVYGGIREGEAAAMLRAFFAARR